MTGFIKKALFCAVALSMFASYAAIAQESADASSVEQTLEAKEAGNKEKPVKEKKAKKEKPAKEKKAKKEKTPKAEKPVKEKPQKAPKVKKMKFDQAAYDEAFQAGDYNTCASMLLGKGNERNAVKDMLDADMLMYFNENYLGSGKGFLETYGKMQQSTADMSGGKAVGAAFSSENSVKYSGAEYERYLAWSMRLACALNMNQADVAKGIMKDYVGTFMDEIQALRALNEEMEKESEESLESDKFKNAQSSLSGNGVSFTFGEPPKKSDVKYENSPFFNYLGTLAYAMNDDFDHAEEFAATYKVQNMGEVLNVPAKKGRLEVVVLSGLIGQREDATAGIAPVATVIEVPGVNRQAVLYTKLSYPTFKDQKHAINGARVSLSNGSSATATLVEDFDEAVKIDVARKAYGAYSRSVFRNVVKNSAAVASVVAAGIALDQAASQSAIAAAVGEIALSKAIDALARVVAQKERADIRQGVYFPNKASAAGFSVAPGTYSVKVEYLNGGSVVETKTIENIVVNEGKVSVAVSSCEK